MATVNGEAEVHIVCINRIDAYILLGINHTVSTIHYGPHVGSTITVVGHVCRDLGTVHGCFPCGPVTAFLHLRLTSVIAVAPTKVVGTYHGIFGIVCLAEYDAEVVPVINTRRVVGEGHHLGFLRFHLDIVSMGTPEGCRIVVGTNGQGVGHHDGLREC